MSSLSSLCRERFAAVSISSLVPSRSSFSDRAKEHSPNELREFINAEIGRLQPIEAPLIAMKFAANHDHEFDVGL